MEKWKNGKIYSGKFPRTGLARLSTSVVRRLMQNRSCVCEFANRFPADRRKVEVSLLSVVHRVGNPEGSSVSCSKILLLLIIRCGVANSGTASGCTSIDPRTQRCHSGGLPRRPHHSADRRKKIHKKKTWSKYCFPHLRGISSRGTPVKRPRVACFGVPKINNDSLVVVTKFRSPNRSPNFCVKKSKTKASPLWQILGPLIFVWKN